MDAGHHAAVSRRLEAELKPAGGGVAPPWQTVAVFFRLVSSMRPLSPGSSVSQAGCPASREPMPTPAPLGYPLRCVCAGPYSGSSSLGVAWASLAAVQEMPCFFFPQRVNT